MSVGWAAMSPSETAAYEQGYKDGAHSASSDWQHALTEFADVPPDVVARGSHATAEWVASKLGIPDESDAVNDDAPRSGLKKWVFASWTVNDRWPALVDEPPWPEDDPAVKAAER